MKTFNDLPYDILQLFFDKICFTDQVHFIQFNKFTYLNLKISDFSNCPDKYCEVLNNDILLQHDKITKLYAGCKIRKIRLSIGSDGTSISQSKIDQDCINKLVHLTEINVDQNPLIYKLDHLKNLKKLSCTNHCQRSGITQDTINNLTGLTTLIAHNDAIYDVNHMVNLQTLDCGSLTCGIGQSGINKLVNLRFLNVNDNYRITNVNHLTNLQKLYCSTVVFGIKQDGISELRNLIELNVNNNSHITDINHLHKLQILYCHYKSGINSTGLNKLTNLTHLSMRMNNSIDDINSLTSLTRLDMSSNTTITNINGLVNLRVLVANDTCIEQTGIANLSSLSELHIDGNTQISNLNHLPLLQKLSARARRSYTEDTFNRIALCQSGITNLTSLTELSVDYNSLIDNVNHLQKLQKLSCQQSSGITNWGINKLTNLIELNIIGNRYVTQLNHLQKLQKLSYKLSEIYDDGTPDNCNISLNAYMYNYTINTDYLQCLQSLNGQPFTNKYIKKKNDMTKLISMLKI